MAKVVTPITAKVEVIGKLKEGNYGPYRSCLFLDQSQPQDSEEAKIWKSLTEEESTMTDFDTVFLTWLQRQTAAFPDSDLTFRVVDDCLFAVTRDRAISSQLGPAFARQAFRELPDIQYIQVLREIILKSGQHHKNCVYQASRIDFAQTLQ